MRAPLSAVALVHPLAADAPSTGAFPLPRHAFDPAETSFADVLETTRAAESREASETGLPPMALGELLKLILILQILGAKVPAGMIRMLRQHGLASYADGLEARNLRIDEDDATGRANQQRAMQLLASGARAA